MINLRGARGSLHRVANGNRSQQCVAKCRQISSISSPSQHTRIIHEHNIKRRRLDSRTSPLDVARPFRTSFLRFASTQSRSSNIIESPSASSPPNTTFESGTQSGLYSDSKPSQQDAFIPDSFENGFGGLAEKPPEEYIGYLKEMGLDYGWGPTAIMETVLEHVHVYTGLPYGASIVATAIIVRAVCLRFYITSSDMSARLAAAKHIMAPIETRMNQAKAAQDQMGMRIAFMERRAILKKIGVKTSRMLLPMALQFPLGFGMFRLLRGMTALPVPGLDTGGFLWFTDLTLPDPFYVLPLTTAFCFYLTFRLGGETGGAASRMNTPMFKIMAYAMPVFTGVFSSFWPAGLQLSLFMGGFFAVLQSSIFRQAWFRRLLNMQPLAPRGTVLSDAPTYEGTINMGEAPKQEKKGFMGAVREAIDDTVKQGKEMTGQKTDTKTGRSDSETKSAKKYEEKKMREAAQKRFEAAQARKAQAEDRKERRRLR